MTCRYASLVGIVLVIALAAACGGRRAPVAAGPPPAAGTPSAFPSSGGSSTPTPPPAPPPVPIEAPIASTPLGGLNDRSIDEINGPDSPLKAIYFLYDSDELTDEAKRTLSGNADVLKTYQTWIITVEGHSDERGTAEYNLALGDRRALTAKNYLVSLGIPADRIRTVSYGEEFPFDPGHTEDAWIKNRRAHFMLTAK